MKPLSWLRNLPWFLTQVFVCELFGHKIEDDLIFQFRGEKVALCTRCMAHLRIDKNGEWASI